MKRLLFLVCCALLLSLAFAAPALADVTSYVVYPFDGSVVAWDQSAGVWWEVPTIPAGSEVVCGFTWAATNRGLAMTIDRAMLMRLTVAASDGSIVRRCDESDCRGFWGPLYNQEDVYDPSLWIFPYNPNQASGVWGRDWEVPCGILEAGVYTVSYSDMFTRAVADPGWERPGTYPPVYPAYDWYEYDSVTFTVVD